MENGHLRWVFPFKNGIFRSYVELPEGNDEFTSLKSAATCWLRNCVDDKWEPSEYPKYGRLCLSGLCGKNNETFVVDN